MDYGTVYSERCDHTALPLLPGFFFFHARNPWSEAVLIQDADNKTSARRRTAQKYLDVRPK